MTLLDEVRALLAAEALDPEAVAALARRARQQPPADPGEGALLTRALRALSERSRAGLHDLSGQLQKASTGRRALRGYGHLKASRLGQRVFAST